MFKCQNCNKEFKTQNALNAHNKKCSFNKKYHIIYKTTNILNQTYYIGMHSTNDIDDGYLGSGIRLTRAIRKYGKENFVREIVEYLPNRNKLALRESEIVNEELLEDDLCINLKPGGNGGFNNEEHKQKFINAGGIYFSNKIKTDKEFAEYYRSIRLLLWQNDIYRKNMLSKSPIFSKDFLPFKGHKHTNETKQKMHVTHQYNKHQQGEKNSQYGTCWINNNIENKKIKKEELEQYIIKGWIKGKIKSDKTLNRLNEIANNKLDKENLIKYRTNLILNSYIDISVIGWLNKMAEFCNLSRMQTKNFMKKYMRDYYQTCYKRKMK